MSWHVSMTIEGSSPKDELETLRAEALAQNPECGDQFDAAKDAAYAIMAMGAVGGPDKKFVITLSGHNNPGHAPRLGWTRITILATPRGWGGLTMRLRSWLRRRCF